MNEVIQIAHKRIGDNEPCFIIAEAGSNHNNDWDLACKLIKVASEAGADAIKFQTFRAEALYPPNAGNSQYLGDEQSIYDIIAANEMPPEWIPLLAKQCEEHGILFLSTPFDEQSADLLAPYLCAIKVASYELTHIPLIEHLIGFNKPLILSTGAATLEEIDETICFLKDNNFNQYMLMQCTAAYPAPLQTVNVRVIPSLYRRYKVPIGLSDHSAKATIAPCAAVSLGARLIEKHFTLDKSLPGPDHRFAIDPNELQQMVRAIRETEASLGDGFKDPAMAETELRHFARRAIFVASPIREGELFTADNLAVLRRGAHSGGLEPIQYKKIIGAKAARDLKPFVLLDTNDIV